jgi:hypothetical protein
MMATRELGETSCVSCGHIDYGEGFEPLELAEDRVRLRDPRRAGMRL